MITSKMNFVNSNLTDSIQFGPRNQFFMAHTKRRPKAKGFKFALEGILRIWLFFHVPFAIALLGALVSHILAVFFYW